MFWKSSASADGACFQMYAGELYYCMLVTWPCRYLVSCRCAFEWLSHIILYFATCCQFAVLILKCILKHGIRVRAGNAKQYIYIARHSFKPALHWIEQGLTSHQTHYRSYWGRVFTGQMT